MISADFFNIPNRPVFNTMSTYFSSKKQSSEVSYFQNKKEQTNADILTVNKFDNDVKQQNNAKFFNGYYDMFVASQALKNSEVINFFNYQMYMKKYA